MLLLIKVLKLFVLPPGVLLVGLGVVFVLLRKNRERIARRVLLAVVLLLWLLSSTAGASFLATGLETLGMQGDTSIHGNEKAIVVLAGGARSDHFGEPLLALSPSSAHRLLFAVAQYRQFGGQLPLLYSGGSGDPFDPVSFEAGIAKNIAASRGVPEKDFWIEEGSRDTYESALAVRAMLQERFPHNGPARIVLVTSASHMPRARAVMRKAGLEVTAAPTDFLPTTARWDVLDFLPRMDAFASSVGSLNEWLGLVGYWLLGRL